MSNKYILLFLFGFHLNIHSMEEEKTNKEETIEKTEISGDNFLAGILILGLLDEDSKQKETGKELLKQILTTGFDISTLKDEFKAGFMLPGVAEVLKEHYEVAKKTYTEALPDMPTACLDIIAEYALYTPDFIDLHNEEKTIGVLNKKRKRKESFQEYAGSEKFLGIDILKTAISYSVEKGDLSLLKYLIKSGADVNCVDENGIPLLAYAITLRSLEIIGFLLENKADPNYIFKVNDEYYTPTLFFVTRTKDQKLALEGIKVFIHYKANINWFNESKKITCLMMSALHGHLDSIKVLVEAQADVNFKNDDEKASHLAYQEGHSEIGDFLRERENKHVQTIS